MVWGNEGDSSMPPGHCLGVPLKCSIVEIYNMVPFTKEKVPWCPALKWSIQACITCVLECVSEHAWHPVKKFKVFITLIRLLNKNLETVVDMWNEKLKKDRANLAWTSDVTLPGSSTTPDASLFGCCQMTFDLIFILLGETTTHDVHNKMNRLHAENRKWRPRTNQNMESLHHCMVIHWNHCIQWSFCIRWNHLAGKDKCLTLYWQIKTGDQSRANPALLPLTNNCLSSGQQNPKWSLDRTLSLFRTD